ncbi:ATP-binding protein [Streptomyces griseoruber]|uniref:ATP-binding protein n=1 Tax=Streptomyces griseoruber TaxID=1943 RepID=UPI0006E35324|nr:ATP-binding protein [Streptomyces griseoruber]
MTRLTSAQPRSTGYPGYEQQLDRRPEAAAEARALVRVALACWNLDEHVDTGTLLISELVANAVRHASGPHIRIHIDRPAPARLLFAVVDHAPDQPPRLRTPGPDDTCGRGLLLLDELADRWGHDTVGGPVARPRTKRVWAELRVTTS